MEHLLAMVRNHRKAAVVCVFLIIAAGVLFYNAPWQGEAEELPLPGYTLEDAAEGFVTSVSAATLGSTAASEDEASAGSVAEKDPQIIVVDVKGAVRHPGIYTLPEGSRVFQAIEAAGSLLENADNRLLNMAAKLVDGAVVYVPAKLAGAGNPLAERKNTSHSDTGEVIPHLTVGLLPDSPQPGVNPPTDANSSSRSTTGENSGPDAANGKININTASAEELQQLKGIGPTKAEEIIRYRETNGPFQSIEELTEIKGIGTKTIEKLGNDIIVK